VDRVGLTVDGLCNIENYNNAEDNVAQFAVYVKVLLIVLTYLTELLFCINTIHLESLCYLLRCTLYNCYCVCGTICIAVECIKSISTQTIKYIYEVLQPSLNRHRF